MPVLWNPWHGCTKISAGCLNCYVYRGDKRYGREEMSRTPRKNRDFDLIIRKKRGNGNRRGGDHSGENYVIPSGELVYTCFTSDFLLDAADEWRVEAWDMIRERSDLRFLFITKRIERFERCIPPDWGEGWNNVAVCCTCENQDTADRRLPVFLEAPIKHKLIVSEPLLSAIDMRKYLGGWIENVTVGGESGNEARICDYRWVLDIREQCIERGVSFHFKQTGARFLKDGHLYNIPRKYQHIQARRANIDCGANDNE